jgi:membrane-associated protease RseP (regulator of RpoE activity)
LADALEQWPGSYYWAEEDGEGRLVLIRTLAPPPRERWWLHTLLFAVSFATVWMGGALLAGAELTSAIPLVPYLARVITVIPEWSELGSGVGLDFAIALMGMLLAHEMGHYVLARRYSINASPPYFLPAPFWFFPVGTFGAFIRLRSPVVDRRQLMDVGAAGPWAGFVVALVALVVGLQQSAVLAEPGLTAQLIMIGDEPLYLGDSLILAWVRGWLVGEGTVVLHPVALAGWFGVLVTMLNLLPLGQLDGGHVVYALLREHQKSVALFCWIALLIMGFSFFGWWVWAGLVLLMGGGRIGHPTVMDRYRPLPKSRRALGWATLVLLILTFTPSPFLSV